MVLSDILSCICFPCHRISVYMYSSNEELLCGWFQDDDVWFDLKELLDNRVLELGFGKNYILLSDEKVHT